MVHIASLYNAAGYGLVFFKKHVDIFPTETFARMLFVRMDTYSGVVEGGGKLATRLGFPTANIALADDSVSGIYAARARVVDKEYEGVAYANKKRRLLELHLLGFSGDLYGKQIEVTLVHKVRDDHVFPDEQTARATIAQDVEKVRAYFKSLPADRQA